MLRMRTLVVLLAVGMAVALAACGGDDEQPAPGSPTTVAPPAGGGLSITVDPAEVVAGERFTIEIQGLPEEIVSGAREVCVGVIDPTGAAETVKLGRVAPGQAERQIAGVLPAGTSPGTYEVAVSACDFAPGGVISSTPLEVK